MRSLQAATPIDGQQAHLGEVAVTSPAPREAWRAVLAADPEALVSQSPAWLDCLCAQSGYQDASRYYETEDGQQMVLPLARKPTLFGLASTAASYQNSWGMGGLISSRPVQPAEMQAVVADLAALKDVHTVIRPDPLKDPSWAGAVSGQVVAIPRLAHVLDLQGGFGTVWEKKFKSVARTAVRKAEKSGVYVECDSTGRLVPVFYDLFLRSLERWGKNQHEPLALSRWRGRRRDPLGKFQYWARFLGEACQVWVAYVNQEPAAAILVLRGKNASYTRGAMDKALAGPVRANDLLHSLAIKEACEAGCRYYHMGESGESRSLSAFKSNFGAQPVPYAEYHFQRLPLLQVDRWARTTVKKLIGFKDA